MSESAAEWAAAQLAAVRDDPRRRIELLARTYLGPFGHAPKHLPFRRAALSFMRWQAGRGVLNPGTGSRWWRSVNDRLIRDGCEAMARSGGRAGAISDPTVDQWTAFIDEPTAGNWYRAHNASIVAGYLDSRHLAEAEPAPERFFLNVVLLRVLYTHALVSAPKLALGPFAVLGKTVGDPRLGGAGVFLSLRRVLPDRYPADDELQSYLDHENRLGRLLDYGVIQPRLQRLYEWSARELDQPGLCELVRDGNPTYAWSYDDRHVWVAPTNTVHRVLRRLTRPGD
ncbi:hypothetical protein Ais01nite_56450 [Asanoa ishikariensis]|uniref:Uncharacterized protein n=1 Tax=Asanoa ishikariensis TaxID=137265 RepID=A0A1H3TWH1_9ACTN|nr:hypothetical protein [Asanoa ishikariensis]GIF67610.1 hypothetical protein Ais01nite_56450 [Asanoa ishikariensis]SDZ54593.1 hypothetical protein SAMN05421684_6507 [Asanoa ishikariensis]